MSKHTSTKYYAHNSVLSNKYYLQTSPHQCSPIVEGSLPDIAQTFRGHRQDNFRGELYVKEGQNLVREADPERFWFDGTKQGN
jgi:hypothetical protein